MQPLLSAKVSLTHLDFTVEKKSTFSDPKTFLHFVFSQTLTSYKLFLGSQSLYFKSDVWIMSVSRWGKDKV